MLRGGGLTACQRDQVTPPEGKTGIGYTIERDKYFYGLAEPSMGSNDPAQTVDMTTDLAGALGVSSYRMFMHFSNYFVTRNKNDNDVTLNQDAVNYYKDYLQKLAAQGITNIVAMSHYYPYPVGFNIIGSTEGVFPRPGSPYYSDFMNLIEKTYYLVSKTFPEVKYWECGNENNADKNCHPSGTGQYSVAEKAQIITDLCFFARRGVKRGNPDAAVVFPALIFDENFNYNPLRSGVQGMYPFLQNVYANINSGDFPSAEVEDDPLLKSTDNDDYFDVMCWHPYNFKGTTEPGGAWMNDNEALYDLMIENGDEGKKVFFTEFGYNTMTGTANDQDKLDERQAAFVATDYQRIYDNLPFVETVFQFRLFDWEGRLGGDLSKVDIEAGYGLFTFAGMGLETDPGPKPKKIGIALYKMINGDDAPLDPLYKYYKGER